MPQSDQWSIPGGVYHVMNRGNRKVRIFEDDRDRKRFIYLLTEAKTKFGVEILFGCQMGTHFHVTVCTPHGNLSEFMQDFEGRFARYSNWRHGRVGHLFQSPFRRVLIENDLHLFIAAAYIFDNPVAAQYVRSPEEWKWSTYAATVGLAPIPDYLSISWIETLFPSTSLTASQKLLRRCIDDPQQIVAYIEAVDPTTEAAIRSYIADRRRVIAQPCALRTLVRPPLDDLFRQRHSDSELVAALRLAHDTYGYKLADVARHLGLHRSTVSKTYRRLHRFDRLQNCPV